MLGGGITTAVKPQRDEGVGTFGKYLVPEVSGAEFRSCEEEGGRNTAGRNQDADPGLQIWEISQDSGETKRTKSPSHTPKLTSTDFQITICPISCQEVAMPDDWAYSSKVRWLPLWPWHQSLRISWGVQCSLSPEGGAKIVRYAHQVASKD